MEIPVILTLFIMEKLLEEFSIGLFFWHSLIFLSLIFLLKKFAWKPILDTINKREEGIKDALESAEKAREEMQLLQADNEEIMKKARIESCLLYTSPSPRDRG